MLEVVVLFEHRRLIDVVIGGHAMIVRVFSQLSDVFCIIAADIDVEEDQVAVHILLAQDMLQILLRGDKSLGKAGFELP